MRKIALFVEGKTELILIREFILRKFCYIVNIDCYAIVSNDVRAAPYHVENPNAEIYFQIFNIGTDNRVVSFMLEREAHFLENGFEKLIGLRDMYCSTYKEIALKIDPAVNDKIIQSHEEQIAARANEPLKISICFSVMEIEAWFLGMTNLFTSLNSILTFDYIKTKTGHDLENTNPETEWFNPAEVLKDVLGLIDIKYDKHEGQVESLCNKLSIEDYISLYQSSKCNSFNRIFEHIA